MFGQLLRCCCCGCVFASVSCCRNEGGRGAGRMRGDDRTRRPTHDVCGAPSEMQAKCASTKTTTTVNGGGRIRALLANRRRQTFVQTSEPCSSFSGTALCRFRLAFYRTVLGAYARYDEFGICERDARASDGDRWTRARLADVCARKRERCRWNDSWIGDNRTSLVGNAGHVCDVLCFIVSMDTWTHKKSHGFE